MQERPEAKAFRAVNAFAAIFSGGKIVRDFGRLGTAYKEETGDLCIIAGATAGAAATTPHFVRKESILELQRRYIGPSDSWTFYYFLDEQEGTRWVCSSNGHDGRVRPMTATVDGVKLVAAEVAVADGRDGALDRLEDKKTLVSRFMAHLKNAGHEWEHVQAAGQLNRWAWAQATYFGGELSEERTHFNLWWRISTQETEADEEAYPTGYFFFVDSTPIRYSE